MIYIIIPVFNRWKYTHDCLLSLISQSYSNYKIVIVDHGSTDNTSTNIRQLFPQVILLNGDPSMWWAAATNYGIKYALEEGASFILTLNNDLTVPYNYIENIYNTYDKYKPCLVGSVSVDIRNTNFVSYCGSIWNPYTAKGISVANNYNNSLDKIYKEFGEDGVIKSDMLPGRGVLIPKEAFEAIGLYDEYNFPHYAADDDFSIRAKKNGYSLYSSLKAIVFSHLDQTGNRSLKIRSLKKLNETFTSIKSPLNLKVRYKWAIKHSPIKQLYFVIDFCRMFWSVIR